MRITESRLRQIIREELDRVNINEAPPLATQAVDLNPDLVPAAPPEEKQAQPINTVEYIVQSGDTLSELLLHFYGLPLSKSNYPIYRLFAKKYMSPHSDNPDVITAGATLKLPASIKPTNFPWMSRIKDSKP